MPKAEVTEREIQEALDLSAQRDFSTALALYQEMLIRAQDDQIRMRILFGIVTCSTWLNLDEIRENALAVLKQFPDYGVSHAFAAMAQARTYSESGRAQEALDLIDGNLKDEVLQRDGFRDWRYEHLFYKGRSLVQLARYDEALGAFDEAHRVYPEGDFEVDMLIERSNCFLALRRFSEAYDTASQVLAWGDEEMSTLAMQHMAECRMRQSRVPEALELYAAIQKRLPCRLVQEERIQIGIQNAMAYLERLRPEGKPS
jgi:tetratricopeptide (TPR) repeat protein